MILRLHGVFITLLALAAVHNLVAARRQEPDARRPFEQWLVLPLQLALTLVLLRDRWWPEAPSLLEQPLVAHLFPALFLFAIAQNVATLVTRGARLSDIPLLLFNVGVGTCVLLADLALGGALLGFRETTLLYEHSVLQGLFGTRLAHLWTLSWHLPLLLPRRPAETLSGLAAGMLPVAVAALAALLLVGLHGVAAEVVAAFEFEPRVTTALPAELATGVWQRPDRGSAAPQAPGDLCAWILPADHTGEGLPTPQRPLVLALGFPSAWYRTAPDAAERDRVLLAGAERLAARLQPRLLLPFPEPDGEGTLHFGPDTTPERWRALLDEARRRVAAVSPNTLIGVRLVGMGLLTQRIASALMGAPAVVDVIGPRLEPGGHVPGQGAHADESLATWHQWLAGLAEPPELWILGAGLSPLAFGQDAQARFVEGCLARAASDPLVKGLVFSGWRDVGHTHGLLGPGDRPRIAAGRLADLLARPRAPIGR